MLGTTRCVVVRRTLPVTTTLWSSSNWANDWTQLNVHTLGLMLGTHVGTSLVDQVTIPGRSDGDSGRVGTDKVGYLIVSV